MLPDPETLALFLAAAAIEEIGWTAYATDDAIVVFGCLGAGIVLGAAWAVWHVLPWLQAGHSGVWVAAQCAFTVLLRMLQVVVYAHTDRSVPAAILLHATANLGLIPGEGRLYDPVSASVGLLLVVAWLGMRVRVEPALDGCQVATDRRPSN